MAHAAIRCRWCSRWRTEPGLRSLERVVFLAGGLHCRQLRISVFPRRQQILVRRSRRGGVTRLDGGPCETQARKRQPEIDRGVDGIELAAKLRDRLGYGPEGSKRRCAHEVLLRVAGTAVRVRR